MLVCSVEILWPQILWLHSETYASADTLRRETCLELVVIFVLRLLIVEK
jgi:hypothetical protein